VGPARNFADSPVARRWIHRWTKGAQDASTILVIDDAGSISASGPYDIILLPATLESSEHPAQLLEKARKLLATSGKTIVILGNAASSCFAVFGGRH
jgi:hypothetical protein